MTERQDLLIEEQALRYRPLRVGKAEIEDVDLIECQDGSVVEFRFSVACRNPKSGRVQPQGHDTPLCLSLIAGFRVESLRVFLDSQDVN